MSAWHPWTNSRGTYPKDEKVMSEDGKAFAVRLVEALDAARRSGRVVHEHELTAAAFDDAVDAEREACAKVIESKFQEARDTEFDLGFETARKVFAAAIRARGAA